MKPFLIFVFTTLFAMQAMAQGDESVPAATAMDDILIDGGDTDLKQFLWKKRPIVVFADSPNDPRFVQQMELLEDRPVELAERDVIILTDTDPSTPGALRERLRPRGFMLVLMVKDGTIYLRKPGPWDVREITRTIDKLPMRMQEMKDRRKRPSPDVPESTQGS